MLFLVEYLDSERQRSYGFYEEESMSDLLKNLTRHRIIPLSVRQIPDFLTPLLSSSRIKISPEEVIELIESLHLVIKSGLPLHSGLLDIAEDTNNPRFKKMLVAVAEDIRIGKSLSSAFKPYEKSLGAMIVNLIHIGEETGQLQATLERGAAFLKRTYALKKKAKQALIYPSFAFATVTAAMLVWMLYVLPQMTELFKMMEVELPPLTLFIIAMSEFLTNYIGYLAIGFILIIVGFKFSHMKYQNIKNEVFQKGLKEASDDVSRGLQLSASFKRTELFSPFMLRMMSVGEESGALDTQLNLIAEHYHEKVNYYAENIGKVIEPLVLIFVGGFMALIMAGLMGPIYDLISEIS
ncbi:MAG: type II secretion system F family protein [Sulfuricurvum sp.]|nr:type II secretion system F family protein [Sulfuricurvum sp.]